MKKGDIKKQEILQTAEAMFCRRGYEKTSIQDILDYLHTSKGSFYHHYASKELLLEEICRSRVSACISGVLEEVSENRTSIENLNLLFSGFLPLNGEKIAFLMMILPVFTLPEGRQIRFSYAEALAESIRSAVIREIERGNLNGELYCIDIPHTADVCLLLLNELWYRICMLVVRNEQTETETDPGDLHSVINAYRNTIERLLSAPYGSLKLLELDDMKALTDQIHYHWNNHSQSIKEESKS